MKRILCVLLVLTLALSLVLAGCGSKQSTDQKAGEPDKKAEEPAKKQEEQVTIRYWESVNDADPNDYMTKWTNENMDLFQKQNPNIKIEFTNTTNGDQYLNKISTEMAANNVPDIFMTWVAGRLEPFVKAGRIHPLNDIIENSGILKETVNPGNLSSTTFDGKVYAIPTEIAGEIVYYNKAIFKKYNLEVPKTWDDLLNVIKILKGNGVTPFSLANKDPWTGTIPYMAIFDRVNGPEEYKKTCFEKQTVFDSEPYIKSAEYLVQLVKVGLIISR